MFEQAEEEGDVGAGIVGYMVGVHYVVVGGVVLK